VLDDDIVNDCIEKMAKADGIILGSSLFSDVTAEMKALIDRAGFVSMANDGLLSAGGVLPSSRSGEMARPFAQYAVLFPAQSRRDRPGRQTLVSRDMETVDRMRKALRGKNAGKTACF